MSHVDLQIALSDLAAGRLQPEESRRLEEHVGRCEACSEWLSTYEWFASSLGTRGAGEAHVESEELARFAALPDSLPAEQLEGIEGHLEFCHSCSHEVEILLDALAEGAVEADPAASKPKPGLGEAPVPVWRAHQWLAAAATLALLIAGTAVVSYLNRGDVEPDVVISALRMQGRQVVRAENTIRASRVAIEAGGEVEFQAGGMVVLGSGFSVEEGAVFTAGGAQVARVEKKDPPRVRNIVKK